MNSNLSDSANTCTCKQVFLLEHGSGGCAWKYISGKALMCKYCYKFLSHHLLLACTLLFPRDDSASKLDINGWSCYVMSLFVVSIYASLARESGRPLIIPPSLIPFDNQRTLAKAVNIYPAVELWVICTNARIAHENERPALNIKDKQRKMHRETDNRNGTERER